MQSLNSTNSYDDIINLPYPTSKNHPPMSLEARAAQFSPFAALTGHSEAIKETARLTDREIHLDEDMLAILNEKLQSILSGNASNQTVNITYFVSDAKKNGGSYEKISGKIKKIDKYNETIILSDNTKILIKNIVEIW